VPKWQEAGLLRPSVLKPVLATLGAAEKSRTVESLHDGVEIRLGIDDGFPGRNELIDRCGRLGLGTAEELERQKIRFGPDGDYALPRPPLLPSPP
jgi:hypothetical protein